MQITIDIPDELAPIVLKILESKTDRDDDGLSDVMIMREGKPDLILTCPNELDIRIRL